MQLAMHRRRRTVAEFNDAASSVIEVAELFSRAAVFVKGLAA
jgi:hypothetical protein